MYKEIAYSAQNVLTEEDNQYFDNVKKRKGGAIAVKVVIYTILTIWAITTLYPFIWILINSFKNKNTIMNDSFALPLGNLFTFDNYVSIFTNPNVSVPSGFINSFIVSGTVVVATLLIAGFTSFVLARYKLKLGNLIYSVLVACMMVPAFATIFPVYAMFLRMGIQDNLIMLILPQIAGNIAFTTILLLGFMQSLPIEVEESAFIDGASVMRIFFGMIMPMCVSSFATSAIFVFLWSYNDLFMPTVMLAQTKTIVLLINEMRGFQTPDDYGIMTAAVTIISIPMMIVYFCLQKHIVKGLTAGAVKG